MNPKMNKRSQFLLLLFGSLLPLTAFSMLVFADSVSNLTKKLIKLRSEVETLHDEVETQKSEMRGTLKSLSLQKTDIQVSIQKEKMRVSQMKQRLKKKTDLTEGDLSQSEELKKVLLDSIDDLQVYVGHSLPFERFGRIIALEEIKNQLETNAIPVTRAAARLWSLVEDEFRLTRENGLYRQTVTIGGEEKLADVVKLGMVMLYFKTSDDEIGKAVMKDGQWKYVIFEHKKDRERVLYLFDSLKKQIRAGYFELPNALPAMEKGFAQ